MADRIQHTGMCIFFLGNFDFFIHVRSQFPEKNLVLPIEKFPSTQESSIMLQCLIIQFQTLSSKSGHGHLRELVAYKRFQI